MDRGYLNLITETSFVEMKQMLTEAKILKKVEVTEIHFLLTYQSFETFFS